MIIRPSFKAHFRVKVIPGVGAIVLSEDGAKALHGLYELVVPLIDGHRDGDAIVDALADQANPASIYYALERLEKSGYITESTPEIAPELAALWHGLGVEPRVAIEALRSKRVRVRVLGHADDTFVRRALIEMGMVIDETVDADFDVVLTDDYLSSEFESHNREALEKERPWLLVRPAGCQLWIGPLFRPGKTGCWACLAQRLRGNRPAEALVRNSPGSSGHFSMARGFTAATLQIAGNMAATEVAKWIARGGRSELEGKLLSIDVRTWQTQAHALVRLPHCPACGRNEEQLDRVPRAIVLESRMKTCTNDGGHRTRYPDETIQRYRHHISPIIGAVNCLERTLLTGDGIVHVYRSGQNCARNVHSLYDVRRNLRTSCSGKGTSDVQAKASGLCEALERFSGVYRGEEPRRRARMNELGNAAIHPNDCMLFSARQYEQRAAWNARRSRWNFVPVPFDESAAVDWSPVWSLTRQEVRYLPTEYCYFDYPPSPDGPRCVGCSNGNAAGNTLEEAILQGFFELVERDAVALWWYNRLQRPAVDPHSFGEPYLSQLTDFLSRRQRTLWVLDLTTDLEIPTFVALSKKVSGPNERIMFGFGSHLEPRVALVRAVTELNQMLMWVLETECNNTPFTVIEDPETLNWIQTAKVADLPYLLPDADTPPRTAADYARQWTDDLREDVLVCQRTVEQRGMEMLVLDQTRADIELPVVKVIVPGLRHFWARFAPGRLYDVPVHLDWLPDALAEEQLNPISMFL